MRNVRGNTRRVDTDDLTGGVQLGGELFDGAVGLIAVANPRGHAQQTGSTLTAVLVGYRNVVS